MTAFIAAISAAFAAPVAHASAPGDLSQFGIFDKHSYHPYQGAHWLYLKQHHCLRSGVTSNTHKGVKTHPYPIACTSLSTNALPQSSPSSYLLNYSLVQGVYEPSNGQYPNNGPGTTDTDASGYHYLDSDFWDLCGPGAADIALEYWPYPPNLMSVTNIDDTSYFNVNGIHERTSWDRNRYRGYMTYLAWQLDWPSSEDTTVGTPWHDNGNTGQLTTGMMDFDHYPSKGVTLYAMAATLNWAASGENSSDWLHYYYTLYWISQNNNHSDLHSDVVWDIAYNNIPVVAEVDASYLPNWDPSGGNIHHFITIVGYNDTAGVYYYMDSCGKTTACNGWSNNSDDDPGTGYPYQVSQGAMWNAVTSITENQGTGITAGDGGWVA